ncbi:MAG: family 16 glycosylhydrolase [Muribaculaceae bacterium]|nr:family 16 glycosylhydrolase [Muribaculaceae bacterium]
MMCLSCLLFASCDGDNNDTPSGIDVTVSEMHFSKSSGQRQIKVTAPTEWTAETDVSWVTVTPSHSKQLSAYIMVEVTANAYNSVRSGHVTITSGNLKRVLSVEQAPNEDSQLTDSLQCFLQGYSLVWHDEFNKGTRLNDEDWTHEVWPRGQVNNEIQAYVNGEYNGRRVTELNDGKLLITAFQEGNNVYSGRVYAQENTGWQYGYFEAKIKLPKSKGTWPAFWMMPANNDFTSNPWPNCGEIDIMEEVGAVPNEVSSTIHCKRYNNGGTAIEHRARKVNTAESAFHIYSMEWTEEYMTFYIDHQELFTYHNDGKGVDTWPFDRPFYIILNLAWGGDWGGMYGVDDSALPVTMAIEYVRVYQK